MKRTQTNPRLFGAFISSLLVLAATAHARVVDIEERSLPVDAAVKLVAELVEGDIKVSSQSGDTVQLVIKRTVHNLSDDDAAKVLVHLKTEFSSEGDHVLLKEKAPKSSREWKKSAGLSRVEYDLHYEVRVPASFSLQIGTVDGDVTVDSIDGACKLGTVDGDVFLAHAGGEVKVQTVDGDIMIKQADGSIDAQSVDGDIQVSGSGTIQAQTVDGDILASFSGQPGGNCKFGTVDGDIRVRVKSTAAVSFDASSMDGDIDCDLSLEDLQIKKRSLRGSINGGGATISLKSLDGNLTIAEF